MSSNRLSPNQREALSAVSTVTNKQEYLSSTNNILNVNVAGSVGSISSNDTLVAYGASTPAPWTWTTATAGNTTQLVVNNTSLYSTLILQVNPNSSVATGAITIEGSLDNTNWNPINVQQINGETGLYPYNGTALNYVASTPVIYQIAVGGLLYVRVRLSTAITGAGGSVSHLVQLSTSGIFGAMSQDGVAVLSPITGQALTVDAQNAAYTRLILRGTSVAISDDTNYGDGLTAGIGSVAARLWNGSSYDRSRGDVTNGVWVNVKTSVLPTGAALETGGNLATISSNTASISSNITNGAQLAKLFDGSNVIGTTANPVIIAHQAVATGGYSYVHITTATTTLVKSGAGTLHALIVNTPVLSGVVELDDAITHTTPIVAKVTYPATLVSDGPDSVIYDLAFSTGMSVTTTGVMDITVVYK